MIAPKERKAIPPQPITLDSILLVEGASPAHFFEALAIDMHLETRLEIRDYGGIGDLGKYLRALASGADFQQKVLRLGITRDAEHDPIAAKQSVETAIKSASIPARVMVKTAILPNANQPGMIETLCLQSVAATPLLGCVHQFFSAVGNCGTAVPTGLVLAKHHVQAYLSVFSGPKPYVGVAAYDNHWPLNHAAFQAIRQFLAELCP